MKKMSAFYPLVLGADNPLLRTNCSPVTKFDTELEEFCDTLLALMYEYNGVGLAAPQIGETIRVIAVTKREYPSNKKKRRIVGEYIMINPEIIKHTQNTLLGEEACLSLPGIFGDVKRYSSVTVKYQDSKGKEHIEKLTGYNAIVAQHEIDHINGILFIDKAIGPLRDE
ncbi:MAG: peptide deformylase [Candidatus Absconditabacteria bacterium]|nr:peptide deformylase [Candidatus Absconditabacteria bacterium]MDD3868424.1 peptide deformylase [Candidatus Absconditabacteria bacterium]MDD4714052.1 peptide deformylase [Candidatus Absconditabacteria bacterium]